MPDQRPSQFRRSLSIRSMSNHVWLLPFEMWLVPEKLCDYKKALPLKNLVQSECKEYHQQYLNIYCMLKWTILV